MARFHTLEVSDVTQETPDSISIGLRIPPELADDFAFIHGQYLTLKLNVNGEELRRSYSICSSPLDKGGIRIAVKKVKDGRASTLLVDQVKPGSKLEVMSPMGNFHTVLVPDQEHHYVAFAAGSGITPILSILMTVLRTEPRSRFSLFFGNTDESRIIFRNKLEELKSHYPDRLSVHHILSQGTHTDELFNGRITAEKAARLLKTYVTDLLHKEYFICGPEQMMVNVSEALERSGVPKKHIHVELFASPVSNEAKKETAHAPSAAAAMAGMATVKVVLDGRETTIELDPKGDTILDAAMGTGLDVPYACKGAVCCTCKARVTEGQVEMDMNYALTDEEVAAGYVLTCQSHPRSANVTVDYDQH